MNQRRTLAIALLAGACMLLAAEGANAGPLQYTVRNQINFVNFENEINVSGGTVGVLEVGDHLRGVLYASMVTPQGGTPINDPVPEITGIFDVEVAFMFDASGGALDEVFEAGYVLFKPAGLSGAMLNPGDPDEVTLPANTMLALFSDPAHDFSAGIGSAANVGAAEDLATGGTLLGAFGMTEYDSVDDWGKDGNGYWYSEALTNGSSVVPFPAPSGTVDFAYGLTFFAGSLDDSAPITPLGNGEIPFGPFPLGTSIASNAGFDTATILFDIVGAGEAKSNPDSGTNDIYDASSEDPAHIHPNPEPSSLVLLGLGASLLGVPAIRRRKKLTK